MVTEDMIDNQYFVASSRSIEDSLTGDPCPITNVGILSSVFISSSRSDPEHSPFSYIFVTDKRNGELSQRLNNVLPTAERLKRVNPYALIRPASRL